MFKYVVFRFVPALAVAAAIVAWIGMPYFDGLLTTWSRLNAESSARAVMNAVERPMSALIDRDERAPLEHLMSDMARAVWVEPELVIQVAFDRWTRAGRMRAPVYKGLRDDIDPATVTREPDADES